MLYLFFFFWSVNDFIASDQGLFFLLPNIFQLLPSKSHLIFLIFFLSRLILDFLVLDFMELEKSLLLEF